MNKRRVSRIATEIKRLISQLLIESIKDPRIGDMTSITDVELTNDLSLATIYVAALGTDEEKEALIEGLNNAKGFIKRELGDKLDLRHIPDLIFEIDNTYEKSARIESLIKEIHEKENND